MKKRSTVGQLWKSRHTFQRFARGPVNFDGYVFGVRFEVFAIAGYLFKPFKYLNKLRRARFRYVVQPARNYALIVTK
jgi:hypothetical protein